MDLKEFYFKNMEETEYHHRFYKAIESVNTVYNLFIGEEGVKITSLKSLMPKKQ